MDIKTLNTIEKVLTSEKTEFQPTESMKRAKSRLWAAFDGEGAPTPSPVPSLTQATQFGTIDKKWWDEPGFQKWLWNRNEFSEKMEYIGLLALEELENTLKSKLVTSAQKIPAIKLALEVSGKLNKKDSDSDSLPTKIAGMTKEELEAFILARSGLLKNNTTTSLTQSDEDDKLSELQ